MKIFLVILTLSAAVFCLSFGLRQRNNYKSQYMTSLGDLKQAQTQLRSLIEHGIFTKGKDGVPNFTKTQIDSYHAAALIGIDPKNHAVAKKMSSDQIDQIITFLRLRKIDQ